MEIIPSSYIAPVRKVNIKVELYQGSTLIDTYTENDRVINLEIQRAGKHKFFGFSIIQRLNVKLVDTKRELNPSTKNSIKVKINNDAFPEFFISEVHRDETTNELSITAYDAMSKYKDLRLTDIQINAPYTIAALADKIAGAAGLTKRLIGFENDNIFSLSYPEGGNFDGNEILREVIDDIAEITASVSYISNEGSLVFRKLSPNRDTAKKITKDKYFELKARDNRRLVSICSTNDLGNAVAAKTAQTGTTQYLRDNAFLEKRTDTAAILEKELATVANLTIGQLEAEWRGNAGYQIGDYLAFTTKDNKELYTFLLDDVISFNGGLTENTQWEYEDTEETASNPTSLGDKLNQTYAIVDKTNKKVDIVVSDVSKNSESISAIQADTKSISATVSNVQKQQSENIQELNTDMADLRKTVETKVDAESVSIAVQKELANGVGKVQTSTGFVFDDKGLSISKTDSEMTTLITENGMSVNKNGNAVLTANNEGVNAEDLHATTYMIIGNNSRFEDWGSSYTACFWIGG